jgi:hypothetical protein
MRMDVEMEQVIANTDPLKTAEKVQAVVSVRYEMGWHLRGTFSQPCLEHKGPGQPPVARMVVQMVFVKEKR